MGKRRLRFDQRKNYERKKRRMSVNTPPDLSTQQELVVSLPLSAYMSTATTDVSTLFSRLRSMNSLPAGWSIADAQQVPSPHQTINPPLTLCKMQCHPPDYVPTLVFIVAFDDQCTWTLRVYGSHVIVQRCTLLSDVEPSLRSVDSVVGFLSILDSSKFCEGNSDAKFRDLAKYSRGVFKDQQGNLVIIMVVHFTCQLNLFIYVFTYPGTNAAAFLDERALPQPTIRHSECALLLSEEDPVRCRWCDVYRQTLRVMTCRHRQSQEQAQNTSAPSSHTNYKYLSTPEKVDRLRRLHDDSRCLQKKLYHHEDRIAALIAREGVSLDAGTTDDLSAIMTEENASIAQKYPPNSCFGSSKKRPLVETGMACAGTLP